MSNLDGKIDEQIYWHIRTRIEDRVKRYPDLLVWRRVVDRVYDQIFYRQSKVFKNEN